MIVDNEGSDWGQALRCWRTVVTAAESTADAVVCSTRIPVFLSLRPGPYRESRNAFRKSLKFARRLLRPYRPIPALNDRVEVLFGMNSPAPATVGNLAPVVAEANRRGIPFAVLTVKGVTAGEHFCSAGGGTVTEEDLLKAVPPTVRFHALARSRCRFLQLKRALTRLDSSWGELLKGLSGVLTLEFAQAAMFRAATRTLLARWKPLSILSTGDFWPVDYNLMTAAREWNIPTLMLQHGMMAPFWWPFVADKLALWGPIFAREIEQLGAPSDRLVFAGMPITDTTFRRTRRTVRPRKFRNSPTILLIANTQSRLRVPETYARYGNFLREIVPSLPNVRWLVKLHPREDDRFYRENGLLEYDAFHVLPKSTSLDRAFKDSDIAVVMFSTAGLEALASGLPLIVPSLDNDVVEHTWWPRFGGGAFAPDGGRFLEIVSQLRKSETSRRDLLTQQNEFLDLAFSNQGNAASATMDLAIQQIEERRQFVKIDG
jgi:hypothetical protein